jgi:hypothetical protein
MSEAPKLEDLVAQAQAKLTEKSVEEERVKAEAEAQQKVEQEKGVEADLTGHEESISEEQTRAKEIEALQVQAEEAKQKVEFAQKEISDIDAQADLIKSGGKEMEDALNDMYATKRAELSAREAEVATVETAMASSQEQLTRAQATAEAIVPGHMVDTISPDQVAAREALETQANAENLERDAKQVEVQKQEIGNAQTEAIDENFSRDRVKVWQEEVSKAKERAHLGSIALEGFGLINVDDLNKPQNARVLEKLKTLDFLKDYSNGAQVPELIEKGILTIDAVKKSCDTVDKAEKVMRTLPPEIIKKIAEDKAYKGVFEFMAKRDYESMIKSPHPMDQVRIMMELFSSPLDGNELNRIGVDRNQFRPMIEKLKGQIKGEEGDYPSILMTFVSTYTDESKLFNKLIETKAFEKGEVISWLKSGLESSQKINRQDAQDRIIKATVNLLDKGVITPEDAKSILGFEVNNPNVANKVETPSI